LNIETHSTMSIRTKVLGLVDVILRVPPLFIIDEILKINLGLSATSTTQNNQNTETILENIVNSTTNILNSNSKNNAATPLDELELYKFLSLSCIKFFLCFAGKQ
jgi:E3 ubiquitin-protein ligase RNF139